MRLSCARWRLEEGLWREIKENTAEAAAAVREGCRRRKTAVISPPRGAPLSLCSAAEETLSSVPVCRGTFAVIAPRPPVAAAEMAAPTEDECVTQRERVHHARRPRALTLLRRTEDPPQHRAHVSVRVDSMKGNPRVSEKPTPASGRLSLSPPLIWEM